MSRPQCQGCKAIIRGDPDAERQGDAGTPERLTEWVSDEEQAWIEGQLESEEENR